MKNNNEIRILEGEELKEFMQILSILQKYYSLYTPNGAENESVKFRNDLLESYKNNPDSVKITVKQMREFEYEVYAEFDGQKDFWIHEDGIEEERKLLIEKGITKHPVFTIVSLGDIYKKSKILKEKKVEKEKTKSKSRKVSSNSNLERGQNEIPKPSKKAGGKKLRGV